MSINELPFEIIEDIFSRLDKDEREYTNNGHPNLCALARTCRHLSDIATTLLYKHVKLEINRREAKDRERTSILISRCLVYPSLVHRIQSVKLRWFYPDVTEDYNELMSHLAKSTSLTRLKSELSHARWHILPALYDYAPGSFPNLTQLAVELNDVRGEEGYLPADQLAKLCELPSLEFLTVRAPIGGFATDAKKPDVMLPKLRHIHFWGCRSVSVAALEFILPRTPNLTCLQLSLPGDSRENNRKLARNMSMLGLDLTGPVRPAFYGELLAPAAASLTHLLLDAVNVEFSEHDGSRIDLSQFTKLANLDLSACLLFSRGQTAAGCPWSREMWKLLPPRLDELHIMFDGHQGLFWSVPDMRQHARARTFDELWAERLNGDHVGWLMALLDRCREDVTSYRTITLSEETIFDTDPNWQIVSWHMTNDLKAAARSAGVNLVIRLRVPRKFESPEFEMREEPYASYQAYEEGTVSYEEEDNNVDGAEEALDDV
ncbi:hypothetical protein GGR54DRAFT_625741 [Hypoxylon sp. NC1633]|nr:hypothetical protein GGR54DRAFT_625741 [Hypoxylon sp. NC1633]